MADGKGGDFAEAARSSAEAAYNAAAKAAYNAPAKAAEAAPNEAAYNAAAKESAEAAKEFVAWCMQMGFNQQDVDFIISKGLKSTTFIARAFRDEEAWESKIVQPRVTTALDRGDDRDPELIEAIYRIVYEEAKLLRDSDVAKRMTAGSAATTIQPDTTSGTAAAVQPGAPGTSTTPKRNAKELLQGDWQEGIDEWETATHPRRSFERNTLLGAEPILARVKYEQLTTQQYSPLGLTEIINLRTYKQDGSINMNRLKSSRDDSQIGAPVTGSTPRSDLMLGDSLEIQDALGANMWCYRWAKYGSDTGTRAWYDFFCRHSRSTSLNNKAFAEFYWACQWRLAVNMREGQTFDQAVTSLTDDKVYVRDQIQEMSSRPSRHQDRAPDRHDRAPDDRPSIYPRTGDKRKRSPSRSIQRPGKGERKGKNPNLSDGARTREKTPRGATICRAFNGGTCNRRGLGEPQPSHGRYSDKRECKYRHVCDLESCRRRHCGGRSTHGPEFAVR